jgi:hypothetical protein
MHIMSTKRSSSKVKVPQGYKPKHVNAIPYKREKYTVNDYRREQ